MQKLLLFLVFMLLSINTITAQTPVNQRNNQYKNATHISNVSKSGLHSSYSPAPNTSHAVPQGKVKHYTNSYGQKVQSPTHYSSTPAGATAVCRDGTYSFSKNKRGTCSHHGGVAFWLK